MRHSLLAAIVVALSTASAFGGETTSILAPGLNTASTYSAGTWTNATTTHHNHNHTWAHSYGLTGGCCDQQRSCSRNVWRGYCGQRRSWCGKRSCGCKTRTRGCGCGNKISCRMNYLKGRHRGRGCGCQRNRCGWSGGLHIPRLDWTWLSHCNRCKRSRHRCSCLARRLGWGHGCRTCGKRSCGCGSHGHTTHHGCSLCKKGVPHTHGPTIIEEHKGGPELAPKKEIIPPNKPMPKAGAKKGGEKSASYRFRGKVAKKQKGLFDGLRFLPAGFSL